MLSVCDTNPRGSSLSSSRRRIQGQPYATWLIGGSTATLTEAQKKAFEHKERVRDMPPEQLADMRRTTRRVRESERRSERKSKERAEGSKARRNHAPKPVAASKPRAPTNRDRLPSSPSAGQINCSCPLWMRWVWQGFLSIDRPGTISRSTIPRVKMVQLNSRSGVSWCKSKTRGEESQGLCYDLEVLVSRDLWMVRDVSMATDLYWFEGGQRLNRSPMCLRQHPKLLVPLEIFDIWTSLVRYAEANWRRTSNGAALLAKR
ncbi:hypothetical protein C8J56DRAFT_901999 [Mycena floridula]|nr:hypothetical protein C8J56DRAFT_901999 [Mycena floridula]